MVFFILYAVALVISLIAAYKRPATAAKELTGITILNEP